MSPDRTDRTPKKDAPRRWWRPFLDALARTGCVLIACKAAHVGRRTAYDRRERSEKFAALWDEALDDATDLLEAEARRRGAQGTERPIYYKGRKVDVVREYSDTLLIFLLKANRPEKFREPRQEHTVKLSGPHGEPILSGLSTDELNVLDAVAQKLAGGPGAAAEGDPGGAVPA